MADAQPPPAEVATISKAAKVQQVLTWILEGAPEQEIAEAVEATWPGEKAKPLILAAMSGMRKSARALKKDVEAWALAATQHLYQKQVEIGEYTGAMRAVKQIAEIAAPQKPRASKPADRQNSQVINIGCTVDIDARKAEIRSLADEIRASRLSAEPADE